MTSLAARARFLTATLVLALVETHRESLHEGTGREYTGGIMASETKIEYVMAELVSDDGKKKYTPKLKLTIKQMYRTCEVPEVSNRFVALRDHPRSMLKGFIVSEQCHTNPYHNALRSLKAILSATTNALKLFSNNNSHQRESVLWMEMSLQTHGSQLFPLSQRYQFVQDFLQFL